MNRWGRAAAYGATAALVWAASEPLLHRLSGARYSDLRLVGAPLHRGRGWRLVALLPHAANGALFGLLLERLGWRGWRRGLLAAEAETLALWPGMAIVDRVHPDRRDGTWPPMLTNGRALAHSAAGHAVFGVTLGKLLEARG